MTKNKKKILYFLTGLLVISLISGWYFMLRKGVVLLDEYCYKKGSFYQGSYGQVVEFDGNGHYVFTWRGLMVAADVEQLPVDNMYTANFRMQFDDGKSLSCQLKNDKLYTLDGTPLYIKEKDKFQVELSGDGPEYVWRSDLIEAFARIESGQLQSKGDGILVLIGLVLYLFGAFGIIFPEKSAMLFRRWRFKSYELNESALALEIVGGAACVLLGAAVISGLFIYLMNR